MGAPPKNKNNQKGLEPRDKKVELRVTKSFKNRLKEHASQSGETVTQFIEGLVEEFFKKSKKK